MTTGTNVLEEILEVKNKEKSEGAGFDYKALNKKQRNRNSAYSLKDCGMVRKQQYNEKFVAAAGSDHFTESRPMLEHSKEHLSSRTKKKPSSWIYHHCRGMGRIRPYCFKLHGQSKQPQQKPPKNKWIPRCVNTGLIAHTSLRASSKEDCYFDTRHSRHMTGVDKYLEDVRPYASSYVTFGDGAKGKIIGIGNLIKHGLPRLDNVIVVKGLTANLISIS